jgi:hypothetical protein
MVWCLDVYGISLNAILSRICFASYLRRRRQVEDWRQAMMSAFDFITLTVETDTTPVCCIV